MDATLGISLLNPLFGKRFWPIAESAEVLEDATSTYRGTLLIRADVTLTVTGTVEVR